jgi:hypothetical protein
LVTLHSKEEIHTTLASPIGQEVGERQALVNLAIENLHEVMEGGVD